MGGGRCHFDRQICGETLAQMKLLVYIRRRCRCYLLLVKLQPGSKLQICSGWFSGPQTGRLVLASGVGPSQALPLTKVQQSNAVEAAGGGRGTVEAFLKKQRLGTFQPAVKPGTKHALAT